MLAPLVVLAAVGAAGDVSPEGVNANAPVEHIALDYSAPAECPGDPAFRAEVRERASGDWEAAPGELARRITVSVSRSGERYVAAIVFLNPEGERVSRSISGRECNDVVNGIALVTALAIQSRVEEAVAQSEPEAPKPAPSAPVPKPAPVVAPKPAVTSKAPPEIHVRFGAAARVASGVGPGASVGPTAFGALEWRRARLGLSFGALWSGRVTVDGVSASYRRLSGRIDGCPYAFGTARFSFEPCAFFEAGSLHGQGEPGAQLSAASGGASPWLVPGVLLRLVAAFEPVVVELELGGGPPLVREQFGVVGGDGVQHPTFQVPPFVLDGMLGIGLRW
ncbi:MAG TPA: hypothetical protein VLJ38_21260 [Polyangiaceae bacterium]|nr:hypothetical protein [Polyangiaceae bacterium]